jgi:asparagine synthase (glutamine-hydrolysing)
MCGIAGFLGFIKQPDVLLPDMANAIHHRGPDDQGVWFDEANAIGLAHARLSILDLSTAGNQPMHSVSARYVMVFNGEIYNHNTLRAELNAISLRNWRGHSDTETLLAAIEQWGLETTLKKTKGMFAIALWDKRRQALSLARDRMGEKPLYYGWVNGSFVFASELKAIKTFPDFNNEVDRNALALFLRFNSIPAPHSIYENVYKLEPGCIVTLNADSKEINQTHFWYTQDIYKKGIVSRFSGTPTEAVNALEGVLSNAVNLQMQADVPLGAFLSGGIDSSTVVALMQLQSSQKINTFSIGFNAKQYNEAEHARAVANHLGTNHFDMYVTERDALNVIPLLPDIYDEPFGDSSQIPTYLVSKIAKQRVTVALSGDAGDELFGGYNRYVFTDQSFNKIRKIPSPLRRLISSSILSLSEERWNKLLGGVLGNRFVNVGFKLHKGANVLSSRSTRELHFKLACQIQSPEDWLVNSKEHKTLLNDGVDHFYGLDPIEQMMAYDLVTYLPTDILTKVDRAAMAVSLETRVPFLDPSVIQFSASLPLEYKIRDGVTKWVLREVLYKYVPKELIERPKMGFGVPLAEWLRGPLRDWAESLLDASRLQDEGFFNVALVRKKWQEHLTGKRNWHHQLWNVLMFQAWLENNN